mgnify:FL=1
MSPLGFAACQSKKCTNLIECTDKILVHLRQVHPLIECTDKTLVHLRQVHPL